MRKFAIIPALLLSIASAAPAVAQTSATPPPAAAGTVARNAWLGKSFVERMLAQPDAAKRQEVLEQIVAPDYIQHDRHVPPGTQGLAAFQGLLWASFPDAKVEVQDVIATNDRVVARYTLSGTLVGKQMLALTPHNQRITIGVIDIWSVKNGKLHEHWSQLDWASLLVQGGVEGLPPPFYAIFGPAPK